MRMRFSANFWVRLVAVFWLVFALAGARPAQARELLLVYWSAADCNWCAAWESPAPGLQQKLKSAKEFKKLTYREVKNERLAEPYRDEDFAGDIKWLKERLDSGEETIMGRPGWSFYVDKILVATFYGTKDWEGKTLPQIKQLVTRYANPAEPIVPKVAPTGKAPRSMNF